MNKKTLLKKTGSFHDLLINSLVDPKKSAAYLQVALEEFQNDNNSDVFLMALLNVNEAHDKK